MHSGTLVNMKILPAEPNDGISFDRIINFPARGIGKTSVEKIHSLAKEKDCSYLNVISNPEGLDVGQKQKKSLKEFSDLILKFKNSYEKLDYYENQNTVEAQDRWSNVEELLNSIVDFQDLKADNNLSDFLEEVSLLTDIDRWNEADKAVTLMTIHSAKGLEFPVVIMAGLEEGLFPLGGSSYELEDLEEERRLFYVALTRAEKKVYLSHANARRRFGGPPMPTIQSRFLHELPLEMLDQVENNQVNKIQSSFNEE